VTSPISVVVPAYNAEPFLKEALESVLHQTHTPIEVLVVDDGSTDSTGRLAESMVGVRCIHQSNAGVSAARNRGTEEAKGRFIAFLDADDAWEADKLAIQALDLSEQHFSYSALTHSNQRLDPIRVVHSDRTVPLLEGLLFRGNVVGTPSSVIVPRAAFLEAGGFDRNLSMCADWDLWIRLSTRLASRYADKPLVRYRIHEESMSTNVRRYESDAVYMLSKAFGLALPAAILARRSEAECRMWEVLAGCYWDQGALRDAFRCTMQSIRRRPTRLASLAISVPHRMMRRALARPR
jgi:glycosyltransferase involved in cell wall biosynthesis